ncbi:penicillin-binding transpeptidase domain-containing protein [Clostridioides difficile]|nr:penicillin-binding transpeptidase domain-containing protein [Clostridioides difficile]AXU66874.1 peptidoglycan glycosyltransferase [Clostridioides difficile]AXU89087.1 peptidoglycan glycosyltransferase [Clostridioides difficile]MCA5559248.1 penicillin-binding transpeptidase domain-containing protein [Clostridioides difficile]MCB4292626.1 penicillin-binding transpeptidase domain-containing protein [Clostridioides difficile]MCE0572399.1 penicillin-binding transpeptidase domain-containing prot
MRKNKKARKMIIFGFLMCLLIVIIVFLAKFILDGLNKNKPDEVFKQYMSFANKKQYEKMYDLLDEKSKSENKKEDFVLRNKKIYEGIDAHNISIKINDIKKNKNNDKLINYDSKMDTLAGEILFSNEVLLTRDRQKNYKIKWQSSVIFPELEEDNTVRVSKLKGKRGRILDRNGVMIAGQGLASMIGLVPGKMSDNIEDLKKLSTLLNVSVEQIEKKLNASWVKENSMVPIKTIEKIKENPDGTVKEEDKELQESLLSIPGVKISNTEVRVYPFGEKTGHLTGYVQNVNAEILKEKEGKRYNANSIIGKIGLESLLEDRIRGIDGYEIIIADRYGDKKETLVTEPKVDGEDVKLTMDSKLQSKLYDQMKNDKGCAVVMNPKTGEVLSLVSSPSYNPNEFILGMSEDRWNELNKNENKPMYNRFKARLCPGSSFKPVTAGIGITTGKINPNENFGHSGLSWQKDSSWGSYKVTTLKDYGNTVNMENALIYSDNIYFAKAALKIGEDVLSKELLKLGFDESMPFEFGLSSSKFGTDNKFETEIQLADTGYGQGKLLVNPVHMASIYSAFVNDGDMIKPHLEFKKNLQAEFWKKGVFSKEAVKIIRDDLLQVVESPNGTGHSAMIKGIRIAGKTGTAEIKASKDDVTGTELGWFNAFTVDGNNDKQYLAIAMIEDVKSRGGSHYVMPIVKSVFED